VYGIPLNRESKREDFLFFVFQSVTRAKTVNTVNMNAPPLGKIKSKVVRGVMKTYEIMEV
jgi:hypothetical protein